MLHHKAHPSRLLAQGPLAAALLTAGFLIGSGATADTEIRRIERRFDVTAEHEIVLDVPLGEVRVDAGAPDTVAIEIIVSCSSRSSRCRERAEEIYLDDSLRRRSLALEVEGYSNKLTSRPTVEVLLTIPPDSDLEIDLGVGELDIEDLKGDLEIDVGVGEVAVFAAEEAIGTLRLAVGVGEVDLYPRRRGQSDSGFLFLGNEIVWDEGVGEAYYVIDVGVGELSVTLE